MLSLPPIPTIPNLASLPLVVASRRLRLRPPTEADAEAMFTLVSQPDLPKYMSWAPHTKVEETRAWFRACAEGLAAGTDMTWLIEHGGAPVGCIGLDDITWNMRALRLDRAALGYWIAPALWGKGLMTEAATAAVHWGFETLGLHKITVACFEPNLASRRVIEKVGFRFYGRQEEDVWRDGQWHAHLRFEMTVGEWHDTTRTMRFSRPT
jgi:ribosomal-protein-alanine N-acetyltransferase